ncbi:ABC transporter substrate-binding protein [Kitasatospora sp. MAP5-34]|uniref:ABC transporter substrate-binding protein n=1 Tax=Kitasatospora sp. MAP5-34 TaxID=3035102 RepID=UPI00247501EC|nr:ABC transporter substrate-binding protein [Kitasatospora sp. MAP5-34]MDH6576910.1 sn-glycerol 3-phosphate transport system substrate-binding protein [Kitasatospora sp. MAP5-34]
MGKQLWGVRVAAALVAAGLTLTACTSSGTPAGPSGSGAPGAQALDNAKGVTTVNFWHSMTGQNATTLTALVDAFNAAHQGKIVVKPLFQGTYDDVIAKYKASVQQKGTPSLVQVYDIGTRFMIDSKQTVPAQAFVDRDNYPLADIEPNIRNYYSAGGKLASMPFNSSMPLLYLNTDAFKEAGLDPAKQPQDLAELGDMAKKLTKKDAGGQTTRYGFGAAIYGWFVEELLAESGTLYCDQGNGRTGNAGKVLFDSAQGAQAVQWWADLVKGGYAANTGRVPADAQAAFKAGKVAMHLESTGVLRGYTEAAKFTVGTAPFPKINATDQGGPAIGGASLWIDGPGHSDAEQRASWEFVKFLSAPEQQAVWHTGTGYFPVNRKALDDPRDKAWLARYPQFQTAIDELHATNPTPATAGCLLGVMPQARKGVETAIEQTISGSKTAQQALSDAVKQLQPAIDSYNSAVG